MFIQGHDVLIIKIITETTTTTTTTTSEAITIESTNHRSEIMMIITISGIRTN